MFKNNYHIKLKPGELLMNAEALQTFFLYTTFDGDLDNYSSFSIFLTDSKNVWNTSISSIDLESKFSENLVKSCIDTFQIFKEHVFSAFTLPQPSRHSFDVKFGQTSIKLIWFIKRPSVEFPFKVQIPFALKPSSNFTPLDFLDSAVNQERLFLEEYGLWKQKCEELSLEVHHCRLLLENAIKEKNSLENTLYYKFVNLLNEKKRKIRKLQNVYAQERNGDGCINVHHSCDSDSSNDSGQSAKKTDVSEFSVSQRRPKNTIKQQPSLDSAIPSTNEGKVLLSSASYETQKTEIRAAVPEVKETKEHIPVMVKQENVQDPSAFLDNLFQSESCVLNQKAVSYARKRKRQ
eukprot:GCRY01001669.1.p1 GENE.GCRY01001669.1~~GCRY01001669.1.p1  ORF type:complete len:348 (+),score=58.63 GCRY01001669.1:91-1134(+)